VTWGEIERWSSRIADSLQSHEAADEVAGGRRSAHPARVGGAQFDASGEQDPLQ
jgi:hypothetical protein